MTDGSDVENRLFSQHNEQSKKDLTEEERDMHFEFNEGYSFVLNQEEIKPKKVKRMSVSPKEVSKEVNFDVSVRINNCFVDASKDEKNKVTSSWMDFMNYLMDNDRNLVSLLADSHILAASGKYSLLQSKNESTNDLINMEIDKIEKYYKSFSDIDMLFAAVNDDLWKKEVEKYRINLKNKIKYKYIDEKVLSSDIETSDNDIDVDEIEKVASEIFDSYEIE